MTAASGGTKPEFSEEHSGGPANRENSSFVLQFRLLARHLSCCCNYLLVRTVSYFWRAMTEGQNQNNNDAVPAPYFFDFLEERREALSRKGK